MSTAATGSMRFLADALRAASSIPGPLAVEVLGRYSGTVFLNDGAVTGAECCGTPDLRTRLIRSGFADDHAGVTGTGSPDLLREDLRNRISEGSVDPADVERLALSVTIDAVQNLLHPPGATPPRMRIHRGRESAHGIDVRARLDDVVAEAHARASRQDRLAAGPDSTPLLCRLARPGVVVDAAQWQVLARVNGRLTPRDIAWANGTELLATLLTVDRLATDGLCAVPTGTSGTTRPEAAPHARPEAQPESSREAHPPTVVAQRGANTPPGGIPQVRFTGPPEWADDLTADVAVDAETIQRLMSGLRALG